MACLAGRSIADTWYIATDGDDGNVGSETAPFATIQRGIDAAHAGDTVFVRGGRYYVRRHPEEPWASLLINGKDGTETAPIRLQSYPGEDVVIDGSRSPDGGAVLTVSSSSYWEIRGLGFEHASAPNTWAMMGIVLYGDSCHNLFEDLEVSFMDGPGMGIYDRSNDNRVTRCRFHHNYDPDTDGGNADGLQIAGADETSRTPTRNVITHSASWNNGDDGFDTWESYRNEFHHCRAWHNGYCPDGVTRAGDGNGFKLGRGLGEHTVTFCVAGNHPAIGFDNNGSTGPSRIYNNTAVRNAYGFEFPNELGHAVKNNVSFGSRIRELANGDPRLGSHNTWSPGLRISDPLFRSTNPADPQFLRLREDSPARDAGEDVGLSGDDDEPDLGAFPFVP